MNPYFSIVFALAIWSSWGLAVRGTDAPLMVIAFYNAVLALVFQGAALVWLSRRRKLHMTSGAGKVAALGACGIINLLLFFYALRATTVSGALLTHYTAPIFVAALAPFLVGDRTGRKTIYAIALSAAGLALIFATGGGLPDRAGLLGLLAGTGSGVAYAFVIIISRNISSDHHPLKMVFVQSMVSIAVILAIAGPSVAAPITAGQAVLFAGLGLVHSTIAVMMYLYGIRKVSAQEAGVLGYIEPVLGIMLAFVFLGESPHIYAAVGGAMILGSGAMVIMSGTRGMAGGVDDYRG